MSRWRAYAAARDVADADLRERYVDALETLLTVADVLAGKAVAPVEPREGFLLYEIEELKDDARGASEAIAEAERRADIAEERLEPSLQRIAELEEQIATLQQHNDQLTEEAIARQPMLDAYADLLARARTFVTFAEKSGVKAVHCRPVGGRKEKKAKAR